MTEPVRTYPSSHLRPACSLLRRPALSTWTVLHDVADCLERHGRSDAASAFRKEGLEIQEKRLDPMDELQDVLELACLYVDIE